MRARVTATKTKGAVVYVKTLFFQLSELGAVDSALRILHEPWGITRENAVPAGALRF